MKVGKASHDRRTKIKTRFKNGKKIRVAHKLDEDQARRIIRQKANGQMNSADIAESMGVSCRWIRKLWSRYRLTRPEDITWPPQMGRPAKGLPGRREHSAVLSCCNQGRRMAVRLETIIKRSTGIHISHHVIHDILKDEELAETQPAKAKQRKWVRYERRYSNPLWHTDYKQLPDGKWFVPFQDDASRLIVGFGVFDEATSDNAIKVLEDSLKRYGKPAQVLTDRGSQFYANEKENAKRGVATFETKLVDLDIKHVVARVRHPQTNGKLERFHLEIERHPKSFEAESASNTVRNVRPGNPVGSPFHAAGVTDPVARLVDWYNNLPHMSLMDGKETPAEAYVRKQAPKDITTEEMKEDLHAKA